MTQLKPIADDLWGHEQDLKLPGGMRLPSRATIVRLSNGGLVIHSPLAIDERTAKEVDALGEVRFIVAPSCYHWMFIKDALARYPRARVLAAQGLAKKLGGAHGIPFEALPAAGHVDAIGDELRIERIEGAPAMNEHAFLHARSRSLIVTDLMFNVHRCDGFGMRLFLRLVGAYQKTAQSRMWRFLVKDRALAAQSASSILGWDFDRVVVAHGDVVAEDARERTRQALSWMTRGAPPLLGAGSALT